MSQRAKLREFLKANDKVTLDHVATLAKTTPATVSRIVNGRRVGRPDTVRRLVTAFTQLGCIVDAGELLMEDLDAVDEPAHSAA